MLVAALAAWSRCAESMRQYFEDHSVRFIILMWIGGAVYLAGLGLMVDAFGSVAR